jgi:SAM-dependent methyltransferase
MSTEVSRTGKAAARAVARPIRRVLVRTMPRELRRWLVVRFPRLPVADQSLVDAGARHDAATFEAFFASEEDPWRSTSERELEKYEFTLAACGAGPFESGLELGCSIGVFTSMLAPRCRRLLAVDISEVALRRARARVASSPHVVLERRTLPEEMPAGTFDLIVCSDVVYYWPPQDVLAFVRAIERSIVPGGRFVSVNWLGAAQTLQTGGEVSEFIHSNIRLERVRSEDHNGWRLDVYERTGDALQSV